MNKFEKFFFWLKKTHCDPKGKFCAFMAFAKIILKLVKECHILKNNNQLAQTLFQFELIGENCS